MTSDFTPFEATIADIHSAYAAGTLTCSGLVGYYLDRIEAYDKSGPQINAITTVSPSVREEAAALDKAYAESGPVGPLHGVPVLMKDQVDTVGMPTTLGSTLFKDFYPDNDGVLTTKLKDAGALIIAKTTLGEFAAGDTHGSLFGSTRNPYDPERTVGGSSGGSGASVNANFGLVAIGQEEFASIRRPAAWNGVVGMRPTLGLVSRSGAYRPWPSRNGSLGPMTRTVEDAARVLDAVAGYDPEDPSTAAGVGQLTGSWVGALDPGALHGARIGIIRESIGGGSEPGTVDFENVATVFSKAVAELAEAGAEIVDPIVVPDLKELLAKRWQDAGATSFENWMGRNANPPFTRYEDFAETDEFKEANFRRDRGRPRNRTASKGEYELARQELMTNLLVVMADEDLDAIVHVTVEHTATFIRDFVNPPHVNTKGVPHLNTFLIEVPSITVPAGYSPEGQPVGITFLGRPFSDREMVSLAYSYEQATKHRVPPAFTPDTV
ncbi:amidase family protein [Kribbella sp. NPDC026596]|uniref:amidase n=1 Tax=Kribbella sp. NPDC026596 TaxID=3155122 RepID=UPI0033DAC9DC